jgi:arylsulfatase A-like enzyme
MPDPLLVVTIDLLPAWILPAYGATWVAMPAATGLAARGIVFDGLVATSDDPRETAAAVLASLADLPPGRVAVVTDDPAAADLVPTGEATVVPVVASESAADDEAATNLGRLFAAATAVAGERRHRAVWCHASSLGLSWDAPEEFREAYLDPDDPPPPAGAAVADVVVTPATDPDIVVGLRHVFAAQLTLLDRCLGRLVDRAGPTGGTLLVGLRGMPLGLHGHVGPGASQPFGECVHLPAVLVDAAGRMAGQRYGGLVTPADLGATLAVLHGLRPRAPGDEPNPQHGRSLAGLFEAWLVEGRDRVITRGAAAVAVTTPGWRLVVPTVTDDAPPRSRLFARPDDFLERSDVADRSTAVCDELAAVAEAAGQGRMAEAWTAPLSGAAMRSS